MAAPELQPNELHSNKTKIESVEQDKCVVAFPTSQAKNLVFYTNSGVDCYIIS